MCAGLSLRDATQYISDLSESEMSTVAMDYTLSQLIVNYRD